MKISGGTMLTVAIATACCGSAFAQQQQAHDPMAGAGAKDAIEAEMRIMDANHDGKVSAEEHAAGAKQMFKQMDANHDNRVTTAEMDASHHGMKSDAKSSDATHGAADGKSHEMSSAEKIKVVDTNGDGVLTADEHVAGSQKMFTKMDTDKDGFLTAPEIKAGHQQLMMSKDE